MKINAIEFKDFLNKVLMDGEIKILEIILNFTDTGIKCQALSPSNVGKVTAYLSKDSFVDYEALGKIGIMHLEELTKIISKFSNEITITIEGSVLIIKGENKKVEVPLAEIELMQDVSDSKVIEFTETMLISAEKISEFLDDISYDKDVASIKLTTEKNLLILSNSGKYKFTHKMLAEGANGGVSTIMGSPFIGALSKLKKGNLQFSFSEMFPIKILEKSDKHSISILVAPRISQEE